MDRPRVVVAAMTYRPNKEGQIDGSYYQNENCVAACTTMLIDRATVGRLRIPARRIRQLSGVTTRRGLTLGEAEAVAKKFGVVLEQRRLPADGTQRGKLQALVAGGRGVAVVINTSITYGTPYATNQFRGSHLVISNQYAWREIEKPHAIFVTEDPGTTAAGWLEWPADLLYRAAEASYGGGAIYTLSTRDTEGVTRQARKAGYYRASAAMSAKGLGRFPIGQSMLVLNTVNGGGWKRPDGSTANGWHRVKHGTGVAFVRGDRLR
jgi:hypothetical protein